MHSVVKIIAAVFLCVIVLVKADPEKCKTEKDESGVCVEISKCYALRSLVASSKDSSQEPEHIILERKKCTDYGDGSDLVCCRRDPPIRHTWTFENTKRLADNYTAFLPNATFCGSYDSDRIIGGNQTTLGQYPWLALIKFIKDGEEVFECGGSLINPRYVVTAAHCITQDIYEVRLGEWYLKTDPDCVTAEGKEFCAPRVIDVGIEKIVLHANFTRRKSQGGRVDLALIRLNQSVSFNEFVQPICLPLAESQKVTGGKLYVSGWGITENGRPSDTKLFAVVDYIDKKQCDELLLHTDAIKIDEYIICARGPHREDSCQGDSGGPLMNLAPLKLGKIHVNRLFLAGVVNNGLSCGTTIPGFYASVFKQTNWMFSNMEPWE